MRDQDATIGSAVHAKQHLAGLDVCMARAMTGIRIENALPEPATLNVIHSAVVGTPLANGIPRDSLHGGLDAVTAAGEPSQRDG